GTAIIVLATELFEDDYAAFEDTQCPLIFLDSSSDYHRFDFVQINNEDAAAEAANYLIANGHTAIGYLRGSFRIKAFSERSLGLSRALRRANLKIDPKHVVTLGTTTDGAYRDMLAHLSRRPSLPTAFFADDDAIALGAMRALQEAGYRIPEDLSLIGFDDLPFGEISSPRLTTIHVHKQGMGEIAVRRLFDPPSVGDTRIHTKILVCTDFVERDSVRKLNDF
ncbi:MAG: LacI family transcriptional regulator, partial [Clostridia bacterium]|nr:LacI family transcriptional regulator [Clostridia bacterium]